MLSEGHLHRIMNEHQEHFNYPNLTMLLGRASHASRCRGLGHRGANRSSLAPYYVGCITITSGVRMRDHHIPT